MEEEEELVERRRMARLELRKAFSRRFSTARLSRSPYPTHSCQRYPYVWESALYVCWNMLYFYSSVVMD